MKLGSHCPRAQKMHKPVIYICHIPDSAAIPTNAPQLFVDLQKTPPWTFCMPWHLLMSLLHLGALKWFFPSSLESLLYHWRITGLTYTAIRVWHRKWFLLQNYTWTVFCIQENQIIGTTTISPPPRPSYKS